MSKIKVTFSPQILRQSRDWFIAELDRFDAKNPMPKRLERLIKWIIHQGKSRSDKEIGKEIDRKVAALFVNTLLGKFMHEDPTLLLQTGEMPGPGSHSVASLVVNIRSALLRNNSRPFSKIDPQDVVAESLSLKARKRISYGQREKLLLRKFPATRNTVFKLLKEGQNAAATIEEARESMPRNHAVVLAAVDYKSKTVELIVAPKKHY